MAAEAAKDADVVELRPAVTDAEATIALVAERVAAQLDDMLPAMGAAYQREVAEYAAMEPSDFAHVLETSRDFVGQFVEALARGIDRPVPPRPLLVGAGRRRQEAGISLDAAMHAFRIASRVAWTSIADVTTAVDPLQVGAVAGRWIEYVDHAATAFAEGHTQASTEEVRRVDARREALVADLLAADSSAEARAVAARHALRLPDRLTPVLVAGADAVQLPDRLLAMLPPATLVGHRGDHLVALVPGELTADVRRSLEAMARGALVVVVPPRSPGAPLLAAVASTESVLGAALATGARVGLRSADDLVLERAVLEHEDLEAHLRREVLAPLLAADPDGIFRAALRSWNACGSIRQVAAELFVHANTVTYRLRRVQEITGLDPRVPDDATRLVLALALLDATPPQHQGGSA